MLAYILALAVGLGSLGIYLAAFFLPEIYRKTDFYWSGLGLFYALVLWVCAGRITGGVLLGQIASVALLGWFGWQTLTLRRQLVPPTQQTELPNAEVATQKAIDRAESLKDNLQSKLTKVSLPAGVSQIPQKIGGLLAGAKDKIQGTLSGAKKPKDKPNKADTTPPAPINPPTGVTGEAVVPRPLVTITTLDSDSKADAIAPKTPVEALDTDSKPDAIATTAANTTAGVEELKTLPEVTTTEAPSAIETELPEVSLAPPAAPEGLAETTSTSQATPNAPVSSPFSDIASSQTEEVSHLKRPEPPDPKLVEEAVEDAQAKNLPASPPDKAS